MIKDIRRLHPRGAANKGVCVDVQGAMLGPDCVLVSRTPTGYRPLSRDEAAVVQKCILRSDRDRDWLYGQCQRIANALSKGEVALAQIYALRIPVEEGDAAIAKAGYNPDEPRVPKGEPDGGEWTTGSVEDQEWQVADVPMNRNKDDCIRYCFEQTSVPRDWGGDPFWACLRACQGRFRSPFFPEFDDHFG
jgi:hypothetical protein